MKDSVHVYFKEISRCHLLTHQQEIEYAQQVQQMMHLIKAMQAVRERLKRDPTLTEWASSVQITESELNHILKRGQRAKQKMVISNLRLVVSIAKKYQHRGLELLDIIQEGNLGLAIAVEKFDPRKGYRFSTYSYWWIRKAITEALSQKARTIRLPMYVTKMLNKIKKVQRQLSQELGRTPTLLEVARQLELTPQQLQAYIEQAKQAISLDQENENNEATTSRLAQLIESDEGLAEQSALDLEADLEVELLMAVLSPQQREILSLRFGLDDKEPLTLAQIGKHFNLSSERVRQIQKDALNKMHQYHFGKPTSAAQPSSALSQKNSLVKIKQKTVNFSL